MGRSCRTGTVFPRASWCRAGRDILDEASHLDCGDYAALPGILDESGVPHPQRASSRWSDRFLSQETEVSTPITEMVVNSLVTNIEEGQKFAFGQDITIAGVAWDGGFGNCSRRSLRGRRQDLACGATRLRPGKILLAPVVASLQRPGRPVAIPSWPGRQIALVLRRLSI